MRFTKAAISALPPAPTGKRVEYIDTAERGLRLRVSDKGSKTYCLLSRVKGGSMERLTIGKASDVTPEQARQQAAELRGAIKAGKSQAAAARARRGEMSFGELYADFAKRNPKIGPRTKIEYQGVYDRCLKARFAKKKLRDVTRAAVAHAHAALSRDSGAKSRRNSDKGQELNRPAPTQANRALALISSMYSWATRAGLWEGANPAKGVLRNKSNSRERYLQPGEMGKFFDAVQKLESEIEREFILMLLFTGARRSNVAAMRWTELDLQANEWSLPAVKMKNGHPLVIPLCPEAAEILQRRRLGAGALEVFVFPGPGVTGHLVEPKRAWAHIRKVEGLADLRMHDLRRTLGSWMVRTGASTVINARALGHRTMQAAERYQRLADIDPVRIAMDHAIGAIIQARGEPKRDDDRAAKKLQSAL